MKKLLFLASIFTLFTVAASAQSGHKAIENHRIHKGFKSGQLTRGEKFRLHKDQAHLRHTKRKAFRDGRISPTERKRLYTMKRHNNRETFRLRHNGRKRVI